MNKYLQASRNKDRDRDRDSDRDDQEPSELTYHSHSASVFSNPWLIAGVFLIVAAIGIYHAFTVEPLYEASATIQLKRNSDLIGDAQNGTNAATEIEILRSRSILSRVVQKLQLDVEIEPKLTPVIGKVIDRKRRAGLNMSDEENGEDNDQLHVSVFNMPQALYDLPFVLTVRPGNVFTLTQDKSALKMEGRVGQIVRGNSPDGDVEIQLAQMHAKVGSQFVVRRIPMFQAVEQLQRALVVAENGKQSGVIRMALQGSNPNLISRILNQIGNEYLHERTTDKSDEADKLMQVYDRQLAESKQRIQKLDDRYAQVLRHYGTADLDEESKALSEQAVLLQSKLADAQQKKLELSSRYLDNHPEMEAVTRQIQNLTSDLGKVTAKRQGLAAGERELSSVTRDKQMSSEINMGLLNGRQKLDALISSERGNVRLVDQAEAPVQSVTMGLRTMVALSCFAGLVLGIIASILKNALAERNRVRLMPRRDRGFRLISMSRVDPSRNT